MHKEKKSPEEVAKHRRKISADAKKKALIDAVDLCHTLIPSWANIEKSKLISSIITGGLTNSLYKVSSLEIAEGGPKNVLVRFFGVGTENFINRDLEAQISHSLFATDGVSVPQIFARFKTGRIEEWIDSKVLHVSELPISMAKIAKMLAHFHSTKIDFEIRRDPVIFETIEKWSQTIKLENFFEEDFINLESEVAFLQEKIKTLDSPVVFSHNDLQENNILNNPETHELHFIDFEYANFNYRGFDLGNHFCEWTIEYNDKYDSGFQITLGNYPTKEQRLSFFNHYLDPSCLEDSQKDAQIDSLYKETEFFTLISHMYWGLWSVIQNQQSNIAFNYQQYAVERFRCYLHYKQLFYSC